MADHEITSSPFTSHSSNNSRISDEDELSHEELVEALSDICNKLKSVNKEKRSLQKSLEFIFFEKKITKRALESYFGQKDS